VRAGRSSEAGRITMNSTRDDSRHGKRKSSRRTGKVSFRSRVLPWSASRDDDARFRRIAERVLITCGIFFLLMPWLPVRQPDRSQAPVVSAPMAKLLLAQEAPKPKPPPPPVKAKAELPKPPPEKAVALNNNKPDPIKPPARKPDAPAKVALNKEAVVPEAHQPIEGKPPGEIDAAKRKVAGIGLLAKLIVPNDNLVIISDVRAGQALVDCVQLRPVQGKS